MEPEHALTAPARSGAGIKLLLTSLLGIAIFFVPFELAGRSTILVDHLAGFLMAQRPLALGLILLLIAYGAISPLLDGRWRARHRQTAEPVQAARAGAGHHVCGRLGPRLADDAGSPALPL